MDLPELRIADAAEPEDLAALADLDLRSRAAAPEAFALAESALTKATPAQLRLDVYHAAFLIALRLWPDEARESAARNVLYNVALSGHPVVRDHLDKMTRMYLGRGWRAWLATLAQPLDKS